MEMNGCALSPAQERIVLEIGNGSVYSISVAGSGKTFVALQCAKRYPRDMFLMLTYNKALQLEVTEKIKKYGITNATCRTYHSLGTSYAPCHDDTMLQEIIKKDLPLLPRVAPRYTVAIIDEAQDMTFDYYTIVLKYLRDSRAGVGAISFQSAEERPAVRFLIMGDTRQAIYQYKGADSRFLSLASHIYGVPFVPACLYTSYRVPPPVASFINKYIYKQEIIISDRGAEEAFPPVSMVLNGGVDVAFGMIKTILSEGKASPGDIYVLATSTSRHGMGRCKPIHRLEALLTEHNESLDSHLRFPCALRGDDSPKQAIDGRITFSTCHAVKGTERRYVFIFLDSPEKSPQDSLPNHIYVGMTRAKEKLVLICNGFFPPWLRNIESIHSDPLVELIGHREETIRRGKDYFQMTVSSLTRFTSLGSLEEIRDLITYEAEATDRIPYPATVSSLISGHIEDISPIIGIIVPTLCYRRIFGMDSDILGQQSRALEEYARSPGCSHMRLQVDPSVPWMEQGHIDSSARHLSLAMEANSSWVQEKQISGAYDLEKLLGERFADFIVPKRYMKLQGRVDFITESGHLIIEAKTKARLSPEDLIQAALYTFMVQPSTCSILVNLATGERIKIARDEKKMRKLLVSLLSGYLTRARVPDKLFVTRANSIRIIYT